MSPPCKMEDLEALARDELHTEQAAVVEAHVTACPSCQRELSWLRTEQSLLLARRSRMAPLPDHVWLGVAARLPLPMEMGRPRRGGRWPRVPQWVVYAGAAAAALIGTVTLSPMLAGVPGLNLSFFEHHFSVGKVAGADFTVSTPVAGPTKFHLATTGADVEVRTTDSHLIVLHASACDLGHAELVSAGKDGIEVVFDGHRSPEKGRIEVDLPGGSDVDLSSTSGELSLLGELRAVTVRSTSGDVHITRATRVEARTASGDVNVEDAQGEVQVQTASGAATITASDKVAPRLVFTTASGDLEWSGSCKGGCQLSARSASGDLRFSLDPKSSFGLHHATVSGELADHLGLSMPPAGDEPRRSVIARYGQGEGRIESTTASGDLEVTSR